MNSISFAGSVSAVLGELQPDQEEERDLRGEGLRRGDADFEPGARVEHRVDFAGDLRAHHVGDRDRTRALLAGELHRLDRVARLAGLRDADHERAGVDDRVAVDPLARHVGLDGDARPLLDRVTADDTCVVRGAAGDDHDPPQPFQLVLVQAEALEREMAVPDPVADRLGDAFGLLVDLLEHERLVARPLGRVIVPVDLDDVVLDCGTGRRVGDLDTVGLDRDDLAVVGELHAPGLGEERRQVRGEEVLTVAEPDDHRRLMTHADEMVRVVVVDDDDREVTFELRVGGAHRRDEVALVGVLEQVRDHFGVGLGAERVPCLPAVTHAARGSSRRCRSARSTSGSRRTRSTDARSPR